MTHDDVCMIMTSLRNGIGGEGIHTKHAHTLTMIDYSNYSNMQLGVKNNYTYDSYTLVNSYQVISQKECNLK